MDAGLLLRLGALLSDYWLSFIAGLFLCSSRRSARFCTLKGISESESAVDIIQCSISPDEISSSVDEQLQNKVKNASL